MEAADATLAPTVLGAGAPPELREGSSLRAVACSRSAACPPTA